MTVISCRVIVSLSGVIGCWGWVRSLLQLFVVKENDVNETFSLFYITQSVLIFYIAISEANQQPIYIENRDHQHINNTLD
jgi:hypothetical protein